MSAGRDGYMSRLTHLARDVDEHRREQEQPRGIGEVERGGEVSKVIGEEVRDVHGQAGCQRYSTSEHVKGAHKAR